MCEHKIAACIAHLAEIYMSFSGVRMIPKKSPNTQYYWVLSIPIPNANADISFLPRFLLELDLRSEVCCANRASQVVLTKH